MPRDLESVLRDLGIRIRELRLARNLTQADVAERIGKDTANYAHVEQGPDNVTVKRLLPIAHALEVELSELFEPPRDRHVPKGRPRKAAPEPPTDTPPAAAAIEVAEPPAVEWRGGVDLASRFLEAQRRVRKRSRRVVAGDRAALDALYERATDPAQSDRVRDAAMRRYVALVDRLTAR